MNCGGLGFEVDPQFVLFIRAQSQSLSLLEFHVLSLSAFPGHLTSHQMSATSLLACCLKRIFWSNCLPIGQISVIQWGVDDHVVGMHESRPWTEVDTGLPVANLFWVSKMGQSRYQLDFGAELLQARFACVDMWSSCRKEGEGKICFPVRSDSESC